MTIASLARLGLAAAATAFACLPVPAFAERVKEAECAAANHYTVNGTSSAGGTDYCWEFDNNCDRDVELSITNNNRPGKGSSGLVSNVKGQNHGHACTSYPNSKAFYTFYGSPKPRSDWTGSVIHISGQSCQSIGGECISLNEDLRVDAATMTLNPGDQTYAVNGTRAQTIRGTGRGSLTSKVTPTEISLTADVQFPAADTHSVQRISIRRVSATSCAVTWRGSVSDTHLGRQRSWTQQLTNASCSISQGG